jgi:hypothetical protein
VYRPRRELQKVAPRNFDAFFAKGQKKTVEIPAVPGREGRPAFAMRGFSRAILPSYVAIKRLKQRKETS